MMGSWVGAETKGWNQEFFFNRLHLELLVQSLEKDRDQLIWGLQIQYLQG